MKICVAICTFTFIYLTFSIQNAHSATTTSTSKPTLISGVVTTAASVKNEEIVEKLCTSQEKFNETKLVEILKPITIRYFAWCAAVPPRCSRYKIVNETEIQLVPVEKTREVKICCEGFQEIETKNGQKKCRRNPETTRKISPSLSNVENFGACGGVLKRDSGNFQLRKSDFQSLGEKSGRFLCTFIIQSSQGNSIRFKLNEMDHEETRVNLYLENYFTALKNPSENLKSLNKSHVNSAIETTGKILTVLISGVKNGENGQRNDSLVSFSWESIPKIGGISSTSVHQQQSVISTASAAHHTTQKGRFLWDDFQPKQTLQPTSTSNDLKNFLNFNLIQIPVANNAQPSSLTLGLSAEFPSCEDFDPCRCNSIQIYRILSNGNLHLVSRYCGVSMESLKIKNLPMQILTVAQISSEISSVSTSSSKSACGKKTVGISWETEETGKSNAVSCADSTTEIKDLKCPGLEIDLEPCTCAAGFGLDLQCKGQEVTQGNIDNLFSAVRRANNLRENDLLPFSRVTISNTILKTLDLTPLLKSSGKEVFISRNLQLTSIKVNKVNLVNLVNVSFPGGNDNSQLISTEELRIQYNQLTDLGVGDLLKSLDPQKLTRLTFQNTKIQGSRSSAPGAGSGEFLPGLSALINLEELHLDDNQIRELSGGQFRRNFKLTQLTLGSGDQTLKKIGPNSFLFDDLSLGSLGTSGSSDLSNGNVTLPLRIYLGSSGLKNENFISSTSSSYSAAVAGDSDSLGLTSVSPKRPVTLDLTHNEIDHISESIFKRFLLTNPQNKIDFQGNLLQCDRKMKWLKDQRNVYESQVLNARCSNDRTRKSVFETSLL